MKEYLDKQWCWLKSFISDPQMNGDKQKGSIKRITTLVLVAVFTFYYRHITNLFEAKIAKLSNQEFLDYLKFNEFKTPDIPEVWALLLAGILAINVTDYFIRTRNENKK